MHNGGSMPAVSAQNRLQALLYPVHNKFAFRNQQYRLGKIKGKQTDKGLCVHHNGIVQRMEIHILLDRSGKRWIACSSLMLLITISFTIVQLLFSKIR